MEEFIHYLEYDPFYNLVNYHVDTTEMTEEQAEAAKGLVELATDLDFKIDQFLLKFN